MHTLQLRKLSMQQGALEFKHDSQNTEGKRVTTTMPNQLVVSDSRDYKLTNLQTTGQGWPL